MTRERKGWVDALRALAIYLVVAGHMNDGDFLLLTSQVKIPLFFAISGYLFRENEQRPFKAFAWDKFKRLMIPYFALGVLLLPLLMAGYYWVDRRSPLSVFKSEFTRLLEGELFWFLPCLFFTELVTYFLVKLPKLWQRIAATAAIGLIGALTLRTGNPLPWRPECVALMCLFSMLGRGCRKYETRVGAGWIAALGILECLTLFLEMRLGVAEIDVNLDIWACLPLNLIASAIGILFLFALFPHLPAPRAITWLGRNSLVVYVFHIFSNLFLLKMCAYLNLPPLNKCLPLALIAAVVSCAMCYVPAVLIDRFCPWLAGNGRFSKSSLA